MSDLAVGGAPAQRAFDRQRLYLVLRTDVANVYGNKLPSSLFSRMIEAPVEQADHGTFDALVALGHSADGTWDALTDDERLLMDIPRDQRERAMVELARIRARGLPPETARRAPAGSFFNEVRTTCPW